MQLAKIDKCFGCTACVAVCPKNAIDMIPDTHGFGYPKIDNSKCIECHLCEKTCPALHPASPDFNPVVYAARAKDLSLRLSSSSGGVFTGLAVPVLSNSGVVFGCVLEKDTLKAVHTKAETLDELAMMRGAKYVQSDLRDSLSEAKLELEKGRGVLFSGMPCQIAGLKRYLGKDYPNLLSVELICHSVPSPRLFEKFKESLGYPKEIVFRSKTNCDLPFKSSFYARAFFNHLCSRESCYNCHAKQGRSGADMTIGDFWGIEKINPKLDVKDGVSIVVVHSQKGEEAVVKLMVSYDIYPIESGRVFADNPYYLKSIPVPKGRVYFMSHYQDTRMMNRLVRYSIHGPWLLWVIRRVLGRIRRIIKA